jgi:hypothetical protein
MFTVAGTTDHPSSGAGSESDQTTLDNIKLEDGAQITAQQLISACGEMKEKMKKILLNCVGQVIRSPCDAHGQHIKIAKIVFVCYVADALQGGIEEHCPFI